MSRRGFTLIELLVVVGIIGLLVAVLLPALANARQAGRATVCLTQLRQMNVAMSNYAVEHRQYLPPAFQIRRVGPARSQTIFNETWDLTSVIENGNIVDVRPGLLWRSDDPLDVQQCPEFTGKANWLEDPVTGYNYNASYLGVGGVKLARAKDPAGTAVFGDGQYAGGANKFMRAPRDLGVDGQPAPDAGQGLRSAGMQGFRHRGETNVGWLDGRASSFGEIFRDFDTGVAGEGLGFLGDDNAAYDLK